MRVRGAARPGCAGAKQASPAFAACGGGAAPRTLPLQKRCKGSRGRPAEPGKIRQFILSKYYNAAAPEKQRNRRFCNRIVKMPRPPPPQNPHPRRRALNPQSSAPLRRSPAPCKSFVPPPPTPAKKRQFAPRALSRYNGAAKRKILRIRREPTPPPPPTPAKKSGRLPRSATFPLFKRRKMRYTGKEIHPDTEDET